MHDQITFLFTTGMFMSIPLQTHVQSLRPFSHLYGWIQKLIKLLMSTAFEDDPTHLVRPFSTQQTQWLCLLVTRWPNVFVLTCASS